MKEAAKIFDSSFEKGEGGDSMKRGGTKEYSWWVERIATLITRVRKKGERPRMGNFLRVQDIGGEEEKMRKNQRKEVP